MTSAYDVIVVGARVAGASTALLLSRLGHRVLMIDRAQMPSDTLSTHALLRTAVLQLERWGLLDAIRAAETPAVTDFVLGFGATRIPVAMSGDFGVDALYAPRRPVLDSALQGAALASGVEFADQTSLVDVHRNRDDVVDGVVVRHAGRRTSISARMVIGADGVHSRLAKQVGARAYERHEPNNAVQYAYFTGIETHGYWFQFTPGFNAGLIPTNDGAACVFLGRPAERTGDWRRQPDRTFQRGLAQAGADLGERVAAATRVSPFRRTSGLPGLIRRPWGPGWALVGDAGYTMDPISAHGISSGLRDAELCARGVHHSLLDPARTTAAMWEYQRRRDRLSRPIFAQSTALARFDRPRPIRLGRRRGVGQDAHHQCGSTRRVRGTGLPARADSDQSSCVGLTPDCAQSSRSRLQRVYEEPTLIPTRS